MCVVLVISWRVLTKDRLENSEFCGEVFEIVMQVMV